MDHCNSLLTRNLPNSTAVPLQYTLSWVTRLVSRGHITSLNKHISLCISLHKIQTTYKKPQSLRPQSYLIASTLSSSRWHPFFHSSSTSSFSLQILAYLKHSGHCKLQFKNHCLRVSWVMNNIIPFPLPCCILIIVLICI